MRKITLKEKDYRKAKRAIKRIENIKPEVEAIHKAIWRIKNKLKNKKIKIYEA